MRRYIVTKAESWQGHDGGERITYVVEDTRHQTPFGRNVATEVWWNPGEARGMCVVCQGETGNSRSCRHVQAVRRASPPQGNSKGGADEPA